MRRVFYGWIVVAASATIVCIGLGSLFSLGVFLVPIVRVGFAAGAFYAPLTATTTRWFTARRGLAVALVSAGIGLGILIIAPLARALTSAWDWRVAMLVLDDLAWLVIIPVALLLREPDQSRVTRDDTPRDAEQRAYTAREGL